MQEISARRKECRLRGRTPNAMQTRQSSPMGRTIAILRTGTCTITACDPLPYLPGRV